jgi:hypothetical protein
MERTITLELTEEMAMRIRQAMCRMAIVNLDKSYECENNSDSYMKNFYLNEREIAHSIIATIDEQMN